LADAPAAGFARQGTRKRAVLLGCRLVGSARAKPPPLGGWWFTTRPVFDSYTYTHEQSYYKEWLRATQRRFRRGLLQSQIRPPHPLPPLPERAYLYPHLFYLIVMRCIGPPGGQLKSRLRGVPPGVGLCRRRNRPRRRAASRRLPWRDVSRPLCAPPMGESLDSRKDVGKDMP